MNILYNKILTYRKLYAIINTPAKFTLYLDCRLPASCLSDCVTVNFSVLCISAENTAYFQEVIHYVGGKLYKSSR